MLLKNGMLHVTCLVMLWGKDLVTEQTLPYGCVCWFFWIPASVAIYKQMLHVHERKRRKISKCVVKKLAVFLQRQHAETWQITSDCAPHSNPNFSRQRYTCTPSSCFCTTARLGLVLFMPVYLLADGSIMLTNFATSVLTRETQQAEWRSLSICWQVEECTCHCGRSHVLGLHHKD